MFDFPGGQAAAFCVTFAVGAVGYFLFKFLRIPNPAMLGSLTITGALSAAGIFPSFDTYPVSFVAGVTIGIMLGQLINRTVIGRVASMARNVLLQTVGMLALSLICGLSLYLISGIDLATSFLCGAMAGIAEMIIVGISLNADVSAIAFFHLFRLIVFIGLLPYFGLFAEKITGMPQTPRKRSDRAENISVESFSRKDFLNMVPLAFAAGALALWMNVPAGAMLGAMFASGGLVILLNKQYKLDNRLRLTALIGIGLVTGERITPEFVEKLGALFVPAIVITVVMMIGSTLLALLLYKRSEWSLTTCLLCTAPAGLTQAAILA